MACAHDVASAVREAGGRALVVGGWVRDRLLGRFGRVEQVGQSFPVFKLIGASPGEVDVALPRRESKRGTGHKGFEVRGDPFMSIAEAARRRDFTVNAISWDPLTGEYFDPSNGRSDLDNRILKAVDPTTFGDDSLRVLRAIQFAARFELTPDPDTKALCRSIRLDDLPPARIWGEIEKLLLRAERPSIRFALALELGVVDQLFPELKALVGCVQEPEWHPEGDVWVHTLQVVDQARQRIGDLDRADRSVGQAGLVGDRADEIAGTQ